ncbi:hypothetical protein H4582DRAFT_2127457 [Lactarius indigo]|nr:hypothetical protein H4582DRAFT_2127457 [Lactarius indigo]
MIPCCVKSTLTVQVRASFLSIPLSDIQRPAIRPFKWLRYVMYPICGARGDLYATLDGSSVERIILQAFREMFLVDYKCLHDQMTSTDQTDCRYDFRQDVLRRDGSCVITNEREHICDAAHLTPWNKGDEYIKSTFDVAFLKTPNYGLDLPDIQRVDQHPADMDTDHFTSHFLTKLHHYDPATAASSINAGILHAAVFFTLGSNVDALFWGTGKPATPQPSSSITRMVLLLTSAGAVRHSNDSNGPSSEELDGLHQREDLDPPAPTSPRWRPHVSLRRGDDLAKAMDNMNAFLMFVQVITPEEASKRREKQMKGEELKAQEASRSKLGAIDVRPVSRTLSAVTLQSHLEPTHDNWHAS